LDVAYGYGVPKLWSETIEEHRREVRAAILDTTAALVAQHGLRGATMSRIADETGIGRATLYKYFPDVESILAAWHERQVDAHLAQLAEIRDRAAADPARRLAAVLEAYAQLSHVSRDNHDPELAALLHRQGRHLEPALQRVHAMICDLLAEAARTGDIRGDVPPAELADYCLHALGAAAGNHTTRAVERLVRVTMAGLRPG
jgi:AcrR family transcriptional regulator